jgi:pilus assembly protein CpaF
MFNVIVMYDGGRKVDKIHCETFRCSIGKSRDNLVQLRGWRIAQEHAFLEETPQGIFIEDAYDSVPTLVNGERVTRFGPLSSVDRIEIGRYELKVMPGISAAMEDTTTAEAAVSKLMQENPKLAASGSPSSVVSANVESTNGTNTGAGKIPFNPTPEVVALTPAELEAQRLAMWRNRVHQEVLRLMDLRRTDVGGLDENQLRDKVAGFIDEVLQKLDDSLPNELDKHKLKIQVLDEAVGLGPLEALLADPDVTEVMVNAYNDIYVEKAGMLIRTDVSFTSDQAVMSAIERIVTPLGRRIDESSPMVDARLKDGSRVNAIIPPLALKGPCLTIRKFSKEKLQASDLVSFGSVNAQMIELMETIVLQRCNVIISGGTGSGKTTLLNIMSNFIPHEERVVTIEDAAELQLNMPHLVSLESRPPNVEGKGEVTIRELVKNCLRMRPDRIVVGECRGGEALDMLQAMNTGHDGSLTTAHANTPRDLIARLEVMVMMSGMELPVKAIREQVASAVDFIVQQTRFSDGSRRVTHISEVVGVEGDTVQLNDIFLFKQDGFDAEGKVRGKFYATGQVPDLYQSLQARGIPVNLNSFKVSDGDQF